MPTPSPRTLDEQVRPGHTALVVVDAQVDYCAEDGLLAVRSGRDMAFVRAAIPRLNRLIRGARPGRARRGGPHNIGGYFGKVATGEQIAAAWAAASGPA